MIDFEALGFNPAPGDAAGVVEIADRYQEISTRLGKALDELNAVGQQTGLWEGAAAEAFFSNMERLPEYLGLAVDSTGAAGAALGEWASALPEMQREAEDLELKARKARAEAEAARDDPAFDLIWQSFFDQEALRAAQGLIDAASARLTTAIDTLEAMQDAAEQLRDRHSETADEIAEQLDRAKDLAPDEPRGGIGGVMDDVTGVVGDAVEGVGDFAREHANRIEAVSGFVSDVSSLVGVAADFEIPVVSQALGAASTVLDAAALGGLVIADTAGASVSGAQYRDVSISVASGVVGLLPGVPQEGVSTVAGELGNFADGSYAPRDGRQQLQLAASFHPLLSGLRPALSVENTVRDIGDWGDEWRAAEEADRG